MTAEQRSRGGARGEGRGVLSAAAENEANAASLLLHDAIEGKTTHDKLKRARDFFNSGDMTWVDGAAAKKAEVDRRVWAHRHRTVQVCTHTHTHSHARAHTHAHTRTHTHPRPDARKVPTPTPAPSPFY